MTPVILCLLAVSAFSYTETPDRLLREAIRLHQSGEYEAAVREYEKFLAVYPEVVQARANLGAALAQLGRYDQAIEQYRKALEQQPSPPVRLNLGLAYYKSARIMEAMREFRLLLDAEPGNRNALLLLADCYFRRGENKKVIELLSPIRHQSRSDRAVAYLLGTALVRDGDVEQGQVLIDEIFRANESAEGRMLRGTVQLTAREYAGALKDLARAVELNPELPDVHAYHGLALLQTGDVAGAMSAFQEELKRDPNDFESNLNVGALLKQEQKYEAALSHLQRARQVRSEDVAVRYQVATVWLAQNKIEDAAAALEAIVKDSPKFVEAHVSLATAYYRLKRKEDGDRQRAIVLELNQEIQARQPGVKK
jgi:tetratricopeptide (TPR) repeat protein